MAGDKPHHEESAIDALTSATTFGLAAGAAYGAVVSAWRAKPEVGQRTSALLFNTAGNIARNAGILAGVAATYQGAQLAAKAYRGKDDAWNSFLAGAAAGTLAGIKNSSGTKALAGATIGGILCGMARVAQEHANERQRAFAFLDAATVKTSNNH